MKIKGNIKSLYTNRNHKKIGDIVIIEFEDSKTLKIDRFWGEFSKEILVKYDGENLIELLEFRNTELKKIMTIEGVATYLIFANDVIIHLYEEIEDIERLAYCYKIEVIRGTFERKKYLELLSDMAEASALPVKLE